MVSRLLVLRPVSLAATLSLSHLDFPPPRLSTTSTAASVCTHTRCAWHTRQPTAHAISIRASIIMRLPPPHLPPPHLPPPHLPPRKDSDSPARSAPRCAQQRPLLASTLRETREGEEFKELAELAAWRRAVAPVACAPSRVGGASRTVAPIILVCIPLAAAPLHESSVGPLEALGLLALGIAVLRLDARQHAPWAARIQAVGLLLPRGVLEVAVEYHSDHRE